MALYLTSTRRANAQDNAPKKIPYESIERPNIYTEGQLGNGTESLEIKDPRINKNVYVYLYVCEHYHHTM
jgi:hypothetical protein